MQCSLIRTTYTTTELSPDFAKRYYLSEIYRLDPFQKELPCFMQNTIQEIALLGD